MCSEAPDTSLAQAAALKQANLSEDQLNWIKDIYAKEAPARAAAQERANAVSDAQLASMKQQDALSKEAADHYTSTFKPIESYIASDAMGYDTPERREQAAGQAVADVGTQADVANASLQRDLESRGVDPSSGAAASALARNGIMEAAQKAAAGNQARLNVETIGHGRVMDAANLGRGIASAQGTTAGIALNAGTQSVGNSQTALSSGTAGVGMVQQGYGQAVNGLGQSSQNITNIGKVDAEMGASNAAGTGAAIGGIAVAI